MVKTLLNDLFLLLLINMTLFDYISFSLLFIYSITILLFVIGWIRIKPFNLKSTDKTISVSINIACRNEESNISQLLDALIKQEYPKENIEIIIVDDHSTDNTVTIVETYTRLYGHIKVLKLSNFDSNKTGKKAAIALGVKEAKYDIIITIDADCTMNKNWLSSLTSYYILHSPKMIIGPVIFKSSKSIFYKFQSLEFMSLIGSGAGAAGIHHPIMCNGANLLFEKKLYDESMIQMNEASGDDIFLMLYAKKIHKNEIQFIKSRDASVNTGASETIRDFFNQRTRWTSKSKQYNDFDIIFTAITVALANLIIVASLITSIFDVSYITNFFALFIIKSSVDLLLLIPVTKFFEQKHLLWVFPLLQFIYPFYVVITVIWGLFGKFHWKNRKYH